MRTVITRLMRLLNLFIWGVWVKDANCPFKLMHRDAPGKVLAKIPRGCLIPMVLVSILARKMKFRVAEVEVEHLPRRGGTQIAERLAQMAAGELEMRRAGSFYPVGLSFLLTQALCANRDHRGSK